MPTAPRVYIWQNLMCVTYLTVLKRMEEFFRRNGCDLAAAPEGADWILIGACGAFYGQIDDFFEKLEALRRPGARLAVYGCLPRVALERFARAADRVTLYIDTRNSEAVERMLEHVAVTWREIPEGGGFRGADYRHFDPKKKYLVVQEGCNAACTFCLHIRSIGPAASVPLGPLLSRVRGFVADAMERLLLEGRDLGSWGRDFDPPSDISELLAGILEVEGDFRVFVNQLGGNWAVRYQERLLAMLLHRKVADIHIPIQTVSDRLLTLMGRETGISKLAPLLRSLGRGRAGRVLRTDLLVGFPTESEVEFEESLAFALDHFDEIAVYGFELHPFTRIAAMKVPFHDSETVNARVARALGAITATPGVVWHCGGQAPQTMMERERRKIQLGRA